MSVDEPTQAEVAQEPLAPERKDRMARRLASMLAVGVGTPFLCVALIANALMPCLHASACKTKRGELLAALAVFVTLAMGLLARRAMRAALDRDDSET